MASNQSSTQTFAELAEARGDSRMLKQVGNYRILGEIASGGMAVVYRGFQQALGRPVAIKALKTEMAQHDNVVVRFEREAANVASFQHENIITIYDVVSDGTFDYIVMEYMPGRSVQDYMEATGPLDIDEALNIVHKCCLGLEYIHYHGVIHRDIKPGNIMYHPVQGLVKLMDFSVAHKIEAEPPRDTGTM